MASQEDTSLTGKTDPLGSLRNCGELFLCVFFLVFAGGWLLELFALAEDDQRIYLVLLGLKLLTAGLAYLTRTTMPLLPAFRGKITKGPAPSDESWVMWYDFLVRTGLCLQCGQAYLVLKDKDSDEASLSIALVVAIGLLVIDTLYIWGVACCPQSIRHHVRRFFDVCEAYLAAVFLVSAGFVFANIDSRENWKDGLEIDLAGMFVLFFLAAAYLFLFCCDGGRDQRDEAVQKWVKLAKTLGMYQVKDENDEDSAASSPA